MQNDSKRTAETQSYEDENAYEELRDSLIAISVVSKRLARVLEERLSKKGVNKCQNSMV